MGLSWTEPPETARGGPLQAAALRPRGRCLGTILGQVRTHRPGEGLRRPLSVDYGLVLEDPACTAARGLRCTVSSGAAGALCGARGPPPPRGVRGPLRVTTPQMALSLTSLRSSLALRWAGGRSPVLQKPKGAPAGSEVPGGQRSTCPPWRRVDSPRLFAACRSTPQLLLLPWCHPHFPTQRPSQDTLRPEVRAGPQGPAQHRLGPARPTSDLAPSISSE